MMHTLYLKFSTVPKSAPSFFLKKLIIYRMGKGGVGRGFVQVHRKEMLLRDL